MPAQPPPQMPQASPMMPRFLTILALLLPLPSLSEPVTLALPDDITASADYLPGDFDKPAILMLHGFLQTHGFHTIHRLAEGLNDEGYAVLSPTLSLGIPFRNKSLACEAIHTHTMEGDHAEIGAWLQWLQAHGHNSTVLIGHSTGSVTLLSYLQQHPTPTVERLIGISIVEGQLEGDPERQQQLQQDLRQRINSGNNSPVKHTYSYCKPITATPTSLLSYVVWTPQRILQTIEQVDTAQVYIMGSLDDRLGSDWIDKLRATGRPLEIIIGANHFMDGEFEFTLQDAVLAELP